MGWPRTFARNSLPQKNLLTERSRRMPRRIKLRPKRHLKLRKKLALQLRPKLKRQPPFQKLAARRAADELRQHPPNRKHQRTRPPHARPPARMARLTANRRHRS